MREPHVKLNTRFILTKSRVFNNQEYYELPAKVEDLNRKIDLNMGGPEDDE